MLLYFFHSKMITGTLNEIILQHPGEIGHTPFGSLLCLLSLSIVVWHIIEQDRHIIPLPAFPAAQR